MRPERKQINWILGGWKSPLRVPRPSPDKDESQEKRRRTREETPKEKYEKGTGPSENPRQPGINFPEVSDDLDETEKETIE